MRPSDVDAVLALWDALLANGQAADARFAPAADRVEVFRPWVAEVWTERQPFPHAWVAEEEGELCGFLSCAPRRALPVLDRPLAWVVGDLFVAPEARGRGVARALVDAAREAAERAGFAEAQVQTLVADERAVAFWQKLGFASYMVTLVRPAQASGK